MKSVPWPSVCAGDLRRRSRSLGTGYHHCYTPTHGQNIIYGPREDVKSFTDTSQIASRWYLERLSERRNWTGRNVSRESTLLVVVYRGCNLAYCQVVAITAFSF